MNQPHLTALFLHQTKDLYWVVDLDFLLIDANDSYKKFMKAATFRELKLNQIEKIASIVNAMIIKIERFVSGRMVMFDGSLQIAQAINKKSQNKHSISASK